MYKINGSNSRSRSMQVAIDNNSIPDNSFEVIPSTNILPEDIIHIWEQGVPQGYMYKPTEKFIIYMY